MADMSHEAPTGSASPDYQEARKRVKWNAYYRRPISQAEIEKELRKGS